MIAPQTYSSYPTFGTSATKCQPTQVKYETGYIPGDVLPAEHLNWFLAGATSNITLASAGIVNLQQEMQTILCCAGQAPSSCLTCVDQVYNAMMYQINASAAQRAPTSHASSATTYGVGTADNYGHLKISDTYTEVLSACSGVAASQKALACVYAAAGTKAGVGNTAGCPLGTASAGVATTAARSDHVHPVTGLATFDNCGSGYSVFGNAGDYVNFIRVPQNGILPYCEDAVNGEGYVGTPGWPFFEINAKTFCGNLVGNAASSSIINVHPYSDSYNFNIVLTNSNVGGNQPLFASTGSSLLFNPSTGVLTAASFNGTLTGGIWANVAACDRDSEAEAELFNVITNSYGYITRLRIGLSAFNNGFRDGVIKVGCNDAGTAWNNFYFRQGQGGDVITTATIGSQSVNSAGSACYAICASRSILQPIAWRARSSCAGSYTYDLHNDSDYPILAFYKPVGGGDAWCITCIPARSCTPSSIHACLSGEGGQYGPGIRLQSIV